MRWIVRFQTVRPVCAQSCRLQPPILYSADTRPAQLSTAPLPTLSPYQNRLLATLSEDDRALLRPHLEPVSLPLGTVLIEPGRPTQSRLLMHPLHLDAGGDYVHNGVRRWLSQDDPEWRMLAAWVRGERTGSYCGL